MKKLLAIAIAIIAILVMAVPAMATGPQPPTPTPIVTVSTGVTVSSATGQGTLPDPPLVKAQWEHNAQSQTNPDGLTTETGDPAHLVFGPQIAPVLGPPGTKTYIVFAAIVTAPSLQDIENVYADVYYPASGSTDPGDNGDLKFEVALDRIVDPAPSKAYFDAAYTANLTTINTSATDPKYGVNVSKEDIDTELDQDLAVKYWGIWYFDTCQLAGTYRVDINALDCYGQIGTLTSYMDWVAVTAGAIDFSNVNYGIVHTNRDVQIPGDALMTSPGLPTIENQGNTYLQMTVKQDDMGLDKTSGQWNVRYDARLGDGSVGGIGADANGWIHYSPAAIKGDAVGLALASPTIVPQILKLCSDVKVDFSINVFKDLTAPTPRTGTMIVGFIYSAGPGTVPVP